METHMILMFLRISNGFKLKVRVEAKMLKATKSIKKNQLNLVENKTFNSPQFKRQSKSNSNKLQTALIQEMSQTTNGSKKKET